MRDKLQFLNRYFAEISFSGKGFFGWQTQPEHRNIQDTITRALRTVLQLPGLTITGCGRTDTGVHASQYFFHFDTPEMQFDPDKIVFKLNRMLPAGIAIHRIFRVRGDLHARFDALSRTYHYHIHHRKNPFLHDFSWEYNRPLNIQLMNEAATWLFQYDDFAAFSKSGGDNKTTKCRILRADWQMNSERLFFTISANRFLRNMVRAIVGTMIDVGSGKISSFEFREIIESKSRSKAGISVPAKGLFLTEVKYPNPNA